MTYENNDTEFKEIYTDSIEKTAVAFANSEGGTIYIGVKDNGEVIGVDNPDFVMQQTANALKNAVKPDIMPFVNIKTEETEGKQLVKVYISVGTNRPYYLGDKGLTPSGVYVRKGSSSQPLSDEGIREMLVESNGKSYEKCRSMNQDLTFASFAEAIKERNLEIGEIQMKNLGIIGVDGLYTNLGLLLSDQCVHSIKIAVFQGSDKAIFRDRKEITGSLIKQLDDTYMILDLYNKTKATFNKLLRIDTRDYPEDAIRECLLNCIVHRDYSFSGSTIINVYDDRIEFVSLGGIVQGLTLEAVCMGASQSRNPLLASMFYRMNIIESFGTGIAKINRLYSQSKSKPVFETAGGVFKVTLPNMNEEEKTEPEKNCTSQEEQVLDYIRCHQMVTRAEIEMLLEVKTTRAYDILKSLANQGKIKADKNGRNTRYTLA